MSLRSLFENGSVHEDQDQPSGNLDSLRHHEKTDLKSLLPQIVASAVSSSFHLMAGVSLGYLFIALGHPTEGFLDILIHVFRAVSALITVSIGGLVCGFLIDTVGRLNTIKLAAVPAIIGCITTAMSENLLPIFVARLFAGVSVACGTFPAIVYTTEIAHPDVRGSLLSFGPAFTLLGSVMSFLAERAMTLKTFMFVITVYPIVASISVVFIPESPVWLIFKGRNEQALKALNWLDKYQPPPTDTMTLAQLHFELLLEEHRKTRPRSGFREKAKEYLKPSFYKPFLILLGLFVVQQLSGVYVIAMCFISDATVYKFSSYISEKTFSIIFLSLQVTSIISNFFLLRFFARRTLMVYGSAAMALCMFVYLCCIESFGKAYSTFGWIPVVAIFLCLGISMVTITPVPWTMIAELFPHQTRGVSYCMVYSLANLMLPLSFVVLTLAINYSREARSFDWFSLLVLVVLLLALIYAYCLLPETHKVDLSDVQKCFESSSVYIKWLQAKKRESSRQDEEITMNEV